MWSTCLFCHNPLGANQLIQTFPVGRRLAFDQKQGRLWVVCRKCEKWNLSPLDERWEAIEDCERRFRDARKRVATENVGLARLEEGLELVRIGEPLRPEFAAWRYGDQFGRRRRKAILVGSGLAAVGAGLVVATTATGILSGAGYGIWSGGEAIYKALRARRPVAVLPTASGERLQIRGKHLARTCLHVPADGGWGLHIPHDRGVELVTGDAARRAAVLLMPKVNAGGASAKRVQAAVSELEHVGDPTEFLAEAAKASQPRFTLRTDHGLLSSLPVETLLAMEMAVNEENERIALEGELALLELEWKEAEEIAAIADTLGLPEDLERQLDALRERT